MSENKKLSKFKAVILFRITEIMLKASLEETFRTYGVEITYASDVSELEKNLQSSANRINCLVICDLILARNELDALVEVSKNKLGVKILGFYPHINTEIRSKAKVSRIDYVVPRSNLITKIKELLAA